MRKNYAKEGEKDKGKEGKRKSEAIISVGERERKGGKD
jgi:hypothetical protein